MNRPAGVRAQAAASWVGRAAGSPSREFQEISIRILHQHIALTPAPLGGAVNLDGQCTQLRRGGIEVGNFKLDVQRPTPVGQQPQATLAQAEESETARQMEDHRRPW